MGALLPWETTATRPTGALPPTANALCAHCAGGCCANGAQQAAFVDHTLLQTWLNPTPPDPVQAKMMWIMPLLFSVMFFFFPAGLVLYWLTNNILSIAQQWFINKRLGVLN